VAGDTRPGLAPLTESVREAKTIAGDFSSSTVLTGKQATKEAVEAALPEAGIFHFAGHARPSPAGVRLLLAGGSEDELAAADINPRTLHRCQLAVLSACATGLGGVGSANSFVRTFLRAGVPHVVATRWPVDSEATMQFMRWFYSELAAGQAVPAAMQHAADSLVSKPDTAHPYYWAGFSAFGAI